MMTMFEVDAAADNAQSAHAGAGNGNGNAGALSPLPNDLSLAIAYVVFQQDCDMTDVEEGFRRGTVFADLYKPFTGRKGVLS